MSKNPHQWFGALCALYILLAVMVFNTDGLPAAVLNQITTAKQFQKLQKQEKTHLETNQKDEDNNIQIPSKRAATINYKYPGYENWQLPYPDADTLATMEIGNTDDTISLPTNNNNNNQYLDDYTDDVAPLSNYYVDDGKSVDQYEKGYGYGVNKDQLDAALENVILKSEMFGGGGGTNDQGRSESKRRRRRRDTRSQFVRRNIRDVALSPDDVLAILTLYEEAKARPLIAQNRHAHFDGNDDDDNDDSLISPRYLHDYDINNNNNNELKRADEVNVGGGKLRHLLDGPKYRTTKLTDQFRANNNVPSYRRLAL